MLVLILVRQRIGNFMKLASVFIRDGEVYGATRRVLFITTPRMTLVYLCCIVKYRTKSVKMYLLVVVYTDGCVHTL